ncbi:MAG: retron system putative HNH endonuclease [Fusobacteriaceae bacterium]
MITIKKNTPPSSFLEYSQNPDTTFNDMPTQVKNDLRIALLKEQGYICAYCMVKLKNEATNTKIEHYVSRYKDIKKELDYSNLFVVCKGNEGSNSKYHTCDTKKSNCDLNINPKLDAHIATISYKSDGEICSSNSDYLDDLNEILNLNFTDGYLISNRKAALDSFKSKCLSRHKGTFTKIQLKDLYDRYFNDKNSSNGYAPYVGIILYFLKKKGKF